jgi:hypothetical protein
MARHLDRLDQSPVGDALLSSHPSTERIETMTLEVIEVYASGGGGSGLIGKITTAGGVMYFGYGALHLVRAGIACARRDVEALHREVETIEDEYRIRRDRGNHDDHA